MGVLVIDGKPICLTLELPWADNQKEISCIPVGEYACKRIRSIKHGETFEVLNVPNRAGILFHVANYLHEIRGCIAVGLELGNACVMKSAAAFDLFMLTLRGQDEFRLTIRKI